MHMTSPEHTCDADAMWARAPICHGVMTRTQPHDHGVSVYICTQKHVEIWPTHGVRQCPFLLLACLTAPFCCFAPLRIDFFIKKCKICLTAPFCSARYWRRKSDIQPCAKLLILIKNRQKSDNRFPWERRGNGKRGEKHPAEQAVIASIAIDGSPWR